MRLNLNVALSRCSGPEVCIGLSGCIGKKITRSTPGLVPRWLEDLDRLNATILQIRGLGAWVSTQMRLG